MKTLKNTDLILNDDGSIYHLKLRPGEIAQTIMLVGDQERVPLISAYFDEIELKKSSREFITHTGRINGFRVSVISTGIGTDNIDIVMNEIDALHNIDFKTKKTKANITELTFIRMGTSGTIQEDIAVDQILVSSKAVGFDALGSFYNTFQKMNCIDKTNAFIYKLSTLLETENTPYLCNASDILLDKITPGILKGITVTMPGFYAAQGRLLRAQSRLPKDVIAFLSEQQFDEERIANIEMETAGIYLLASVLGHQAISFNAILANRVNDVFSSQPEKTIQKMIEHVLSIYFA